MASDAVYASKLTFAYHPGGAPVIAIDELRIPRGDLFFLHGPSGTGKTTLLGLLSGILPPPPPSTGAELRLLGHDLSRLSPAARDRLRGAHVGYIFQMFNLIPYLSVRDNILLPLHLSPARRQRLKSSPEAATEELAKHLRIDHLLDRPVTALSVGQQQRIAAARALIGRPEVIVADEPTSALDQGHREAFLRLLFAEVESCGATLLFVSHDHTLMPLFRTVVSLADINRAASPLADDPV